MTRQWKRLIRVTVSGKGGSATFDAAQSPDPGLSVSFSIAKGIGSKQNTASITIVNLSKSRRNMLGEEYDTILLETGYQDAGLSVLFKGQIRDVTHTKSSPDIESAIECGDGDKAVGQGAVSKTFKAGTKPKEIVEYLRDQMPGLDKGKIVGLDDLPAYKRPVSLFGYAFRELDELGRQHGFYWSIQNEKFQAVARDRHLGGAVLLSSETGLIGCPEITDTGVKVKALLNPQIMPGKLIDVRSDFLDEESGRDKRASDDGGGLFRVANVTFTGASRSSEYYVEVEGNRVQGDKVTK